MKINTHNIDHWAYNNFRFWKTADDGHLLSLGIDGKPRYSMRFGCIRKSRRIKIYKVKSSKIKLAK